ncbi:hypothetical protein ACOSQ4_023568 [Xanthoceras sorbifolium]
MGRVKIPLKKVENKICRHNSFSKRKNGLVKKAYELSTLCDVDVGLIIFSPAGKLFLFDGKRRTEEILKSYIGLPHHQHEISLRNVELEDVEKQLDGGSDKHAPSMAFSGIKYLAGNKVNDGSDQFDYGFFSVS